MSASKAVSSHLIDERDRKIAATELQQSFDSSKNTKSPVQIKSPKAKFFRQDNTDAYFISPKQPPSHRPNFSPTFVTVQDPSSLKEWSVNTVKGDKYDKFKSPALFWEIRLKENQIGSEKASRPTLPQMVALCEILFEYAEKAAAQGDDLLGTVKEQICSAVFPDYSMKNLADYANHEEMLKSCVPYCIIAERLQSDKIAVEKKIKHLEKMVLQPLARSFQSSAVQTDEAELDVNSGAIALQRKILGLMYQVEEYETENFNSKLERQELDTKTKNIVESQKEQIMRLTEFSTRMRKQCELEKESSELYRHQVLKLEAENQRLTEETKAMAKEQISLRFSYDKKLAFVSETLKAERQRFTKERADWLESFVSERYDLFNSMLFDGFGNEYSEDDDSEDAQSDAKTSGIVSRKGSMRGSFKADDRRHSQSSMYDSRLDRDAAARQRSADDPQRSASGSEKKRVSIATDVNGGRESRRQSQRVGRQMNGEEVKHEVWSRLTELGKESAERLEALYTDEGKLESEREHHKCIRDILKGQELAMQQLLLTSPALHDWSLSSPRSPA